MSTSDGDVPVSDIESDRAAGADAPEKSDGACATWGGYGSGLPAEWAHSPPWRQEVQRRRITLLDELARLELDGTGQETGRI